MVRSLFLFILYGAFGLALLLSNPSLFLPVRALFESAPHRAIGPLEILKITGPRLQDFKIVGLANCVVIDRSRGLFATVAHAVGDGDEFFVRINGGVFLLKKRDDLINWNADVALLYVSLGDREKLPDPPEMSLVVLPSTAVELVGYKDDELDEGRIHWSPYHVHGYTVASRSDIGVSVESDVKLLRYRRLQSKGLLLQSERSWLYNRFIFIQKNYLSYEFQAGLSGSPVFDSSGKVMGLISKANDGRALLVPSFEIKKLLAKVK